MQYKGYTRALFLPHCTITIKFYILLCRWRVQNIIITHFFHMINQIWFCLTYSISGRPGPRRDRGTPAPRARPWCTRTGPCARPRCCRGTWLGARWSSPETRIKGYFFPIAQPPSGLNFLSEKNICKIILPRIWSMVCKGLYSHAAAQWRILWSVGSRRNWL